MTNVRFVELDSRGSVDRPSTRCRHDIGSIWFLFFHSHAFHQQRVLRASWAQSTSDFCRYQCPFIHFCATVDDFFTVDALLLISSQQLPKHFSTSTRCTSGAARLLATSRKYKGVILDTCGDTYSLPANVRSTEHAVVEYLCHHACLLR